MTPHTRAAHEDLNNRLIDPDVVNHTLAGSLMHNNIDVFPMTCRW